MNRGRNFLVGFPIANLYIGRVETGPENFLRGQRRVDTSFSAGNKLVTEHKRLYIKRPTAPIFGYYLPANRRFDSAIIGELERKWQIFFPYKVRRGMTF